MKAITFAAPLLFAAALPGAAGAQEAPASDIAISLGLTGATDYVWRGVSQSDNDPAVFATVDVTYAGFYAGAGTENVRFASIEQEWDLRAGYAADLGGAKLDVGVVRYGYVDAPADIDTLEVKAALSGNLGKLGVTGAAYHTWDYFGSGRNATYLEASARYPVSDKLTLSGVVGRQQIHALQDYTNWNLGLGYAVVPGGSLDVRYHDTDSAAFGKRGKARLVGSFSLAF